MNDVGNITICLSMLYGELVFSSEMDQIIHVRE